jgi:MurNAc alpha-1-phosphate uridylyltransferase
VAIAGLRALIFAAGRGERMRPLTERTPKPMLRAGGRMLIEYHLDALARAGVREVVINTAHLAECFAPALGDGARYGLRITYSYEGTEPLETGGGMRHALPHLGGAPFVAVNGDIWTDFDFAQLPSEPAGLAHLVLVDNPAHHPRGDFHLDAHGLVQEHGEPRLTYTGIGVNRPELVAAHATGTFKLAPLLYAAARVGRLTAQYHAGAWTDVGTPERLTELDRRLS